MHPTWLYHEHFAQGKEVGSGKNLVGIILLSLCHLEKLNEQ